jgi:carbamoyl-phosphate synthase / aspartate carbamoyltransferase
VLGTPIDTIILTEDRELFAQAMAEIGERCAKSASATDMESAMKAGAYVGAFFCAPPVSLSRGQS